MSQNPEVSPTGLPASELCRTFFLLTLLMLVCLPSIPESHSVSRSWSSRVVTTKLGLARGFLFMPRGYEGVEVFYGLPYASPPLGSLRLMPPVSGSPWSGTKMNEEPGPVCPQVFPFNLKDELDREEDNGSDENDGNSAGVDSESSGGGGRRSVYINETEVLKKMPRGRLAQLRRLIPFLRNQSEDCLYLNIYIPSKVAEGKVDRPTPVLVFIPGEDYSYGAAHAYDPSMLVSQGNVIVITFNFRLGILGFLNANSDGYFKSPANFALLDQIAALHWVQENIGVFGGDKGNVTLMGHGKGAVYVNFLMISNALPSEPLFHRVILMSGSALSPLTTGLSNGKDLAKRFAGKFKCPIEPPSNMLQCLRQLPLQYFLDSELWNFFGPSDDGVVIEQGIRENILRDKLSRYPMIFGVTKSEFLPTLSEHDATYGLETEKRREVLKQFIDGFYSSYRNEILAAAIHEYTDWERPVQHPISVRDEVLEALSDSQIVAPMVKVAELNENFRYFYAFEYQSKISDYAQRLAGIRGEDLTYVFGIPLFFAEHQVEPEWDEDTHTKIQIRGASASSPSFGSFGTDDHSHHSTNPQLGFFTGNFTRNEVQLSQTLVHLFSNFIRTGNPNNEPSTSTGQSEGSSTGGFSPSGPSGGESQGSQNRFAQDKSSSKPKLIEWPSYDTLFKKYLSIDLRPRIKNHYRAHKLSFWLHLVPELMRTGGGGGISPTFQNRPEGHHYPNIINSSNSTSPHLPSIQLVGPPYWEQHPFYFAGNYSSYPGGDISGPLGSRPNHRLHHQYHENEGFQIYSTALTVTIAVGCSLLILNILVFAACYYYRDKRRTSRQLCVDSQESHQQHQPLNPHQPGPVSASSDERESHHQHHQNTFSPMDLQLHRQGIPGQIDSSRQLSCSAETMVLPSIHNTPMRLKENGSVMNLLQQQQQHQHHQQYQHQQSAQMLPMPNICGDLPNISNLQQMNPDSGRNIPNQQQQQQYQQAPGSLQSTTLPSNKRQRNSLQNFELSMPDAILAAAMMLNYRQNNSSQQQQQGGTDFYFGGHKSSSGKRPALNMKEQLLLSAGISSSAAAVVAASASGFNTTGASGSGGNRPGVVVGNLPGRSSATTTGNPHGGSVGGNGNATSNVIQFDFDNGSKTVPRPPKRHTPTVKFSPDTFTSSVDASTIGSGSVSLLPNPNPNNVVPNNNTSPSANSTLASSLPPSSCMEPSATTTGNLNALNSSHSSVQLQPQLKSSLKKHSSYSSSGLSEELNV